MIEKAYSTPDGNIRYWVSQFHIQKPWLVFLPGLTADHHLFDRQIAFFENKFCCFVWDAPAHGLSRPFSLTFSLADTARYLQCIFEKETIHMPILIGQSMGGYIAQMYMDLYPGSVSGFLSIDSCPLQRRYFSGWELALLKHAEWMYLGIPWKMLVRWGVNGTSVTEYGRALMKQTMESYERKEYCALAGHGYRIVAKAIESGRDFIITCPVLLLCGEKDAAGSAKSYNRKWNQKEGYPIVWLANAGHNSNTDVPDEVNRHILAFIDSIGPIKR